MASPDTMAGESEIVSTRKDQHLDVVAKKDVAFGGLALGFDRFTLEYDALPEIDLDEVDLGTTLLGKKLAAPLVIGAMTGGSPRAGRVNERLARVAAKVGVGLALGSQRAMIVDPSLASTFDVKVHAPDIPLVFGNVGAVQLNYGVDVEAVREAIARVSADALNVHLNPLQEAVQPEGDTRFGSLAPKIDQLARAIGVPVVVKECGAGLSRRTLRKLAPLAIAGVEVAGVGGTSWSKVESHRAPEGSAQQTIGMRLGGHGVPTVDATVLARDAMRERVVIASGGVRTGMDVAIALALGADAVALAAPLLIAAEESEAKAEAFLRTLVQELRVILFTCGLRNLVELSRATVIAASDDPLVTAREAHVAGRIQRGW
ncbi:MAG: type 2 isopentenyl-diphosphate Delta-isomerase [Deltaproteobacteria bacterium]|nr:type 2 isopentenyl-diphosphate Delta-isomerase [Deltaproteobacteria bacterium]